MRRRPYVLLNKEIDFVFERVRVQLSMDEATARGVFQRHRWMLMLSGKRIKRVHRELMNELGGWHEAAEAATAEARLLRLDPRELVDSLRILKRAGLEGDSLIRAMRALFGTETGQTLKVRW